MITWMFVMTILLQVPDSSLGKHELQLYISPDLEGVTGDTLVADVGYGFFMKDRYSLGGLFQLKTVEDVAPGEKDYRFREVDFAFEYVFGSNKFLPFVRATAGMAWLDYLDHNESSLTLGAGAGLKYAVTEHAALDCSATVRNAQDEVFVNDFKLEKTDLGLKFGVRIRF
ncbi:MAG: outer membrane beta-barrel protein [Acidobacteria bacterium]|nr:outer membrane beta-barrel protein [Acidobacteriota bacterium]